MDYDEFLARKTQVGCDAGFEPVYMPDCLFPFQRALVEWAVRKGHVAWLCGKAGCVAVEALSLVSSLKPLEISRRKKVSTTTEPGAI